MSALGSLLAAVLLASCSNGLHARVDDKTKTRTPSPETVARSLCETTYGTASRFVDTRLTTVSAIRAESSPFVPDFVLAHALSGRADDAPAAWCLYGPQLVYPSSGVGGGKGTLCVAEVVTAGPLNSFEVSNWCGAAKPRYAGPPFPTR
jgi:hypothetical protein